MTFTALSLAVTLTVSSAAPAVPATAPEPRPLAATAGARVLESAAAPRKVERWMVDAPSGRPAALTALYAAHGAVQLADVYSTRKAVGAGAREANPLMRDASKGSGAMLAMKAATGLATIYFAEKAWKKNRKGAVILMAALNGVTAAIAANNLRNARR